MAKVPEPVIGSRNGAAGSIPPRASTAAARFSFSGASVIDTR
jgi:hypothetical protein